MEKWLSIVEISRYLGLAENTARRYANLFDEYLKSRKFGRAIKYTEESLQVIGRVAALYQEGLGTEEIRSRLKDEFPVTINVNGEEADLLAPAHPATAERLAAEFNEQLELMRQQQDAFNRALLDRLEQQQRYIEESVKVRDEQIMTVLREIQEGKKALAAAEQQKRWWEIWKR